MHERPTRLGWLSVIWALCGHTLLIAEAVVRLGAIAVVAISDYTINTTQLFVAAVWVAALVYYEGVRGFGQRLGSRLPERLHRLWHTRSWIEALGAPAFLLSMYRDQPRRVVGAWALVLGIVAAAAALPYLVQPWRGLCDLGVVAALCVGYVLCYVRAREYFIWGLAGAKSAEPNVSLPLGSHR